MPIKESSDELNPAIVTNEPIVSARPARSIKDFLALAIATCGVGYLPLAPGTWGSLLAVGLYLALFYAVFGRFSNSNDNLDLHATFVAIELLIIATVSVLGVWAASRTERVLRVKDPGKVVVDEVAGQLIALLAVPLVIDRFWLPGLILSFLLFRLFDIVKPYPARKFESLKGGWGVMADDLVAGVYAAIGVALIMTLRGVI